MFAIRGGSSPYPRILSPFSSQAEVFATALFDSAVTPRNPWGNGTEQDKKLGAAKQME